MKVYRFTPSYLSALASDWHRSLRKYLRKHHLKVIIILLILCIAGLWPQQSTIVLGEGHIARPELTTYKPLKAPKLIKVEYTAVKVKMPSEPPNYATGDSVWDRLAQCESGGNWSINSGNGFYGGLQFNLQTWQSNGGKGYPHENSREEQIRIAKILHSHRGFSPWPHCSSQLGLR